MGLCGFTQPSVLCMLGHRSGPAHQFRKNQFGGCGTDIYTYRYIYIYICAILTTHWMCGAFREVYQWGVLLLVRVESPISQHTAVLLDCVKPRCPRRFCRRGAMFSYRCSRDRKILIAIFNRVAWRNRRPNLLPTIIGTYIKAASCAREGGVALSTQRSCWVAWSNRRLNPLPTIIGTHKSKAESCA